MKLSKYILIGGLIVAALGTPVFAYAGIVKVHKTDIIQSLGVTDVLLITGAVNQLSAANMLVDQNYTVDDVNGGNYRIYNIHNAPAATVHLLLKKVSSDYRILSAGMGTTVPTTTTFDSTNLYKTGSPTPPGFGTITTGFETAKVLLISYSQLYDYSGIDIQVSLNNNFDPLIPANTTTSLPGKPSEYKMGELVDGRILASGTKYYFRVRGKVDGVDPSQSQWASTDFTTKAGGGPQEKDLVLNSTVQSNGTGINNFALPFAPAEGNKWYAFKGNGDALLPQYKEITNALSLVKAINAAAGQNVVSTFGKWKSDTQELKGAMVEYDQGLNVIKQTSIDALNNNIGALAQGEGYQVYITNPVTLKIKNTP